MTDPSAVSAVAAGGQGAAAGGQGEAGGAGDVLVRSARREDMPRVHEMIHELAAFEGFPQGPAIALDDLLRDGFDSSPPWFFTLVAERGGGAGGAGGGELVGYALCNRAYSSWTARAFYVEDLYVVPSLRRAGVGRRLLGHLAQMAVAEGVSRVDWHVAEGNAAARAFYRGLGARDLRTSEGRAALRLDQPHIHALARTH
ncbi:hypothetical protein JYU34_011618 [Plutella xylostella]|uniref:N-acetyltransferase domain-containing protein n=1 Tax=Plutella xylostella TaxID=51655 RepID=A0ABQ7QHE4_PLUXY|nr:hypothetical protein JYU34_011618 [Plutella xylostella]